LAAASFVVLIGIRLADVAWCEASGAFPEPVASAELDTSRDGSDAGGVCSRKGRYNIIARKCDDDDVRPAVCITGAPSCRIAWP